MTPGADERWVRRIMGGLGARPVGHAEPLADSTVPATPPRPVTPAAGTTRPSPSTRLTDWWRTGRPHLTVEDEGPQVPVQPTPAPADDSDDQEDDIDGEEPAAAEAVEAPTAGNGPVAAGPVDKTAPRTLRTPVRIVAGRTDDGRELRAITFNLTAAGLGYATGLVDVFGRFLPAAEQAALGTLSFITAAGAACAAWLVTGHQAARSILPRPPVSRTVIAVGAAEIGRRSADLPFTWLNEHGAQWGLGPDAVSLLLTAGGICGGLWWLIDRRARTWHWLGRWIVRIPLASALLATALYAPGPA